MSLGKRKIGDDGELVAIGYLQGIGVDIIDTNFFVRGGEIDIIGKKGDLHIFYEVKYRNTFSHGLPEESLTKNKKQKFLYAINSYCLLKKINQDNIRADFLAVSKGRDGKDIIGHFENISLY